MKRALLALASGLLFGFGLALAQMTHPQKVMDFLDLAGDWDPSLALVMAGAVAVTAATFPRVLRAAAPRWDSHFFLAPLTRVDRPLLVGAALFGIGWGLSGYCPGPAIALLAAPNREALVVLPALLAGAALARLLQRRGTQDDAPAPDRAAPAAQELPTCG